MLSEDEKQRVTQQLVGELTGDPRAILLTALPPRLQERLAANGDTITLFAEALQLAMDDARTVEPPAIVVFLRTLGPRAAAFDHQQELASLAARLAILPPPAPDRYEDQVLRGDLPFLDRAPLRSAVRKLLEPQAGRLILAVSGNRWCGKSMAGRYIDHLASHRSDLRYARLVIDQEKPAPQVIEVATELIIKLEGSAADLAPALTNQERWAPQLAGNIAEHLAKINRGWSGNWVISIDGLNKDHLDEPTAIFVRQLAEYILGTNLRRNRLLLIDFDLTALAKFVADTRVVTLDDLSHADTTAELTKLLTARGRADAPVLIDDILRELKHPLGDLRELGRLCGAMLESLDG